MPGVQAGQEARGVVDILVRVEHVVDAAEMITVIVVVDLHAAEVDQCLALASRVLERGERFAAAAWKDGFSFYIHGVRLKAALLSGLGQADRVEDARRHAVAIGGAQDLRLAGIGGGVGGAGSETRYTYRRQRAREQAKQRG